MVKGLTHFEKNQRSADLTEMVFSLNSICNIFLGMLCSFLNEINVSFIPQLCTELKHPVLTRNRNFLEPEVPESKKLLCLWV